MIDTLLSQLPQQLANGFTLGAVYALVALGYALVFGVLRRLNFAHGDVYMVGAFIGYAVLTLLTTAAGTALPSWAIFALGLVAAMLVCGLLGLLLERVAYRPLRGAPRLAPLLSGLGAAVFLQNSVLLVASANQRAIPAERLIPPVLGIELGGARLSATRLIVIAVALGLMLGLHAFVTRTGFGRQMRAVAADHEAAAMLGINVDRVTARSFVISAALAGAAGVLVGMVFTRVGHSMGFAMGLKGLAAAVVGGIGSMPGALLGGLLLGLTESLAIGLVSPTFSDLIAFGFLIIVLLLRPAGIAGRAAAQKV